MLTKALLLREISLAKNTIGDLLLSVISCLLVVCIFLLILEKNDSATFHGLIIIITTLNILMNDYISDEFRLGVTEQLFLLPIPPLKVVLIKLGVNFIRYLLVHIILWFIVCAIFQVEFHYLQYSLFTLNLTVVSFLVTAMSLSLPPRQHIICNMLLLPIIFPQIILSILSISDRNYIYLALSLTIVMMPVFILFSTLILKKAIADS